LKNKNNRRKREIPGSKYKKNEKIRVPQVRVVEGLINADMYNTSEAIRQAQNLGLDLILISEKANPPVCKAVEFSKFLYEEKKRKKEQKDKQVKVVLKEVQFTPNIAKNDYETKKRNIIKFLKKGNKVKATIFFKGRNIMFKERGQEVLLRLATEVEEFGIAESLPKLIGKRMSFTIKSITKKKQKKKDNK